MKTHHSHYYRRLRHAGTAHHTHFLITAYCCVTHKGLVRLASLLGLFAFTQSPYYAITTVAPSSSRGFLKGLFQKLGLVASSQLSRNRTHSASCA